MVPSRHLGGVLLHCSELCNGARSPGLLKLWQAAVGLASAIGSDTSLKIGYMRDTKSILGLTSQR
jgi:hypothetical protein